MDKIRHEYISGTAHIEHFGGKVKEARLRCLDMCRGETVDILDK